MTSTFKPSPELLCILPLYGPLRFVHLVNFELLIVVGACGRLSTFEPDITFGQPMFPEPESSADTR